MQVLSKKIVPGVGLNEKLSDPRVVPGGGWLLPVKVMPAKIQEKLVIQQNSFLVYSGRKCPELESIMQIGENSKPDSNLDFDILFFSIGKKLPEFICELKNKKCTQP